MSKPTILIVDDEPTNLSVFVTLLDPFYQVRACKTGVQALRAVQTAPRPDLILLDVMMPDMDGYSVLARLREQADTRQLPVIFVTALGDDLDEERGLALGAVDYLIKPVRPAIMLARIRTHLEIKQVRDQLARQNDCLEAEVQRRMRENLLIQDLSLSVIMELAETRDTETGNHILRTQAYIEILARKLRDHPAFAAELAEPRLTWIVKAAPLHDIGKIGIPDRILLKPGRLTPEEWSLMKTHSQLGADAIRRAIERAGLLDMGDNLESQALATLEIARVIALHHHEKWDGSGYPQGLAGDAIPLPARLMALADVYDALSMRRVYKSRWTLEDTLAFIRDERGRHFDPTIVDAFLSVSDRFAEIQRRLADPVPDEEEPDPAVMALRQATGAA